MVLSSRSSRPSTTGARRRKAKRRFSRVSPMTTNGVPAAEVVCRSRHTTGPRRSAMWASRHASNSRCSRSSEVVSADGSRLLSRRTRSCDHARLKSSSMYRQTRARAARLPARPTSVPRNGTLAASQGLQRLLKRQHARRLVAVHAADADDERSGSLSPIAAEQPRKGVLRGPGTQPSSAVDSPASCSNSRAVSWRISLSVTIPTSRSSLTTNR